MSQPARIALIGANGQLGVDLLRSLGGQALPFVRPELDVRDEAGVERCLLQSRPTVVVNCAAMTHVDACEHEAEAAYAVNAVGALHVARQAARLDAAVVYISTDYVFGGEAGRVRPYVESDAPDPLGVYGASKLAGEQLTRAYNPRHLIVRTSGLYGHAGARGKGGNFVETMLRLAKSDKPLRVVDDQRLSPTSTREFAERLVVLIGSAARGTFHLAARDSCTWHEFAAEIMRLAGVRRVVDAIRSAEFGAAARRPALSALASERLAENGIDGCRGWREMLADYMAGRSQPAAAGGSTFAKAGA